MKYSADNVKCAKEAKKKKNAKVRIKNKSKKETQMLKIGPQINECLRDRNANKKTE